LQLNLQGANLSFLGLLSIFLFAAAIVTFGVRAIIDRAVSRRTLYWSGGLLVAAVLIRFYAAMGWPFNETLWLSSSPYIATIIVLVIMSAGHAPGSLGKTFHASR
jgi:simple sugar transport system permease protein